MNIASFVGMPLESRMHLTLSWALHFLQNYAWLVIIFGVWGASRLPYWSFGIMHLGLPTFSLRRSFLFRKRSLIPLMQAIPHPLLSCVNRWVPAMILSTIVPLWWLSTTFSVFFVYNECISWFFFESTLYPQIIGRWNAIYFDGRQSFHK